MKPPCQHCGSTDFYLSRGGRLKRLYARCRPCRVNRARELYRVKTLAAARARGAAMKQGDTMPSATSAMKLPRSPSFSPARARPALSEVAQGRGRRGSCGWTETA